MEQTEILDCHIPFFTFTSQPKEEESKTDKLNRVGKKNRILYCQILPKARTHWVPSPSHMLFTALHDRRGALQKGTMGAQMGPVQKWSRLTWILVLVILPGPY